MNTTGRKRTKIDDPKVDRLLKALAAGHFVEEACQYAPISRQTYYRWLREAEAITEKAQRGEPVSDDEQAIRDLGETIKKAEVSGQNAALDTIREAIKEGTWQAAAWFLERRNKKWSNRTEITGPDGGPVQTVTVEDVDEKIRNLIAAAEANDGSVDAST